MWQARTQPKSQNDPIFHNELSPFIHQVIMASPPFWGSTLFVSSPFGITNANAKKKCIKVCSEKNYMHFLVRHLDSNSRTAKLEQFGDMSLGYRGHNVWYWIQQYTLKSFVVNFCVNFQTNSTRTHNYLGKIYWLGVVVLHMGYNISSRSSSEMNFDGVISKHLEIYLAIQKIGGVRFLNFSNEENIFKTFSFAQNAWICSYKTINHWFLPDLHFLILLSGNSLCQIK